jgi:hypothetical protein
MVDNINWSCEDVPNSGAVLMSFEASGTTDGITAIESETGEEGRDTIDSEVETENEK